jgi:dolichol-phosphate mannosyltransferase
MKSLTKKSYVIIPTYNEVENLPRLVDQIFTLYPAFYIIIVDDNSPDGTGIVADDLSKRDSHVHVIHRPQKAGLGTAYVWGFKAALAKKADLIFEMDSDFSHDPKYINEFLAASKRADLVIGSRYINGAKIEGQSFRRRLLSRFANIYASKILVKPVYDFTSGFRCYRRSVLQSINLDHLRSSGYAFQIEMTHLTLMHGFKVREIPITFKERKHGVSKISVKAIWEAFWLTLSYRASLMEIL